MHTLLAIMMVLMVITGVMNTIAIKWADLFVFKTACGGGTCEADKWVGDGSHLCAPEWALDTICSLEHNNFTDKTNGTVPTARFNHPFFEAQLMFTGELMCLFAFYIIWGYTKNSANPIKGHGKDFPVLFCWITAACDMGATSLMYLGLNLTDASVFQMLRGIITVFTCAGAVIFLREKRYMFHWTGIAIVVLGLGIVGAASFMEPSSSSNPDGPLGDLFIILAQLIQAGQVVLQQKWLDKYDVHPLQQVGYEGFFGWMTLCGFLVLFSFVNVPCYPMFPPFGYNLTWKDEPYAIDQSQCKTPIEPLSYVPSQLSDQPMLLLPLIGNICSIAFFNFAGMYVTKLDSATTRMVLDSVRTLVIWMISLLVKWEPFLVKMCKDCKPAPYHFLIELFGFAVFVLGGAVYKGAVKIPGLYYPPEDGFEVVPGEDEENDTNKIQ